MNRTPQPLLRFEAQPRQDAEGRFCLDDLHRAFGADPTHAPAMFLRDEQTQRLIEALHDEADGDDADPVAIHFGHDGGTFVARELAYAYAAWVNPEFMAKMIDEAMHDGVAEGMLDDLFPEQ